MLIASYLMSISKADRDKTSFPQKKNYKHILANLSRVKISKRHINSAADRNIHVPHRYQGIHLYTQL